MDNRFTPAGGSVMETPGGTRSGLGSDMDSLVKGVPIQCVVKIQPNSGY